MNFRRVLGIVIASETAMVVATAVLSLWVRCDSHLVVEILAARVSRIGNLGRGTRTTVASAPAARDQEDTPRRAAASDEPVRLTAHVVARALGATATRR